jgi:hypothetical protein
LQVQGDVTGYSDLEIRGYSNLLGGIFTPSISGVTSIDETTRKTLQSILGYGNDIYNNNLGGQTSLGDINSGPLASEINYDGVLNITGTWLIDNEVVTASAEDINKLNNLRGDSGGIVFTTKTDLRQDNENLYWDDDFNRLGILTNSPSAAFSVEFKLMVTSLWLIKLC